MRSSPGLPRRGHKDNKRKESVKRKNVSLGNGAAFHSLIILAVLTLWSKTFPRSVSSNSYPIIIIIDFCNICACKLKTLDLGMYISLAYVLHFGKLFMDICLCPEVLEPRVLLHPLVWFLS